MERWADHQVGGFMLRNSVDIDELKNRQSFPKNNYFCYKWRIKDHFNRSIDRQKFHLNAMGAGNDVSLMNDRILQLYKSSFGSSRKDLVVGLAQEAMNFLDRRRSQQKKAQQNERALSDSTRQLVDYVFNILLAFSAELNSLMGLSELFITASEPEGRKVSSSKESLTHILQAGFSTNLYRLVIDGRLDGINFYIVPADTMLALQEITLNYNPIEKWHSKLYPNGDVYWFTGDTLMQDDMAEIICAELLRALIQATEERLMPPEQYVEQTFGKHDNNLYELAAPAPWEVDLQRRRGDQKNTETKPEQGDTAPCTHTDRNWQTQTARGIQALPKDLAEANSFSTPGLAEAIGLMTGEIDIIEQGWHPLTNASTADETQSASAAVAALIDLRKAEGTIEPVTQYGRKPRKRAPKTAQKAAKSENNVILTKAKSRKRKA